MTVWSTHNGFERRLRRWLGASGSLSARLAQHGTSFTVRVLDQGMQHLHPDEARALGLPGRRPGYVREVVLSVDGVPVVFARSVTAHLHSVGPWRAIRGLGTRPLADVLFKRMGIERSPLEFASLSPASRLGRDVERAWRQATGQAVAAGALPVRRSVFTRCGAPLLVMEVFADAQHPWCWPSPRRVSRKPVLPRKPR
jgi:chorismate--pyruvate lyase